MNENDLQKLQENYALRGVEIGQLHKRITSLEEENARLKEQLRLQQERLFGKKARPVVAFLAQQQSLLLYLRQKQPLLHPILVKFRLEVIGNLIATHYPNIQSFMIYLTIKKIVPVVAEHSM